MSQFELITVDLEESLEELYSIVLDKELKDSHQHILNIVRRDSLLNEDDAFDIENIFLLCVKRSILIAYSEGFNHGVNEKNRRHDVSHSALLSLF
ncbi:hypothetical protein [Paenibacillus bouchesdurhonensis]|uniref:hypothetical protein n=1 Tax=Paenibacillus bouchesdurhonensis TaxID=1870990 RepID=UPI000DA60EA2|nr:hypothetical protein [Paenibacillus bouchesdurhonensis]